MDFSVTLVKFDIFVRLEVFSKTSKDLLLGLCKKFWFGDDGLH